MNNFRKIRLAIRRGRVFDSCDYMTPVESGRANAVPATVFVVDDEPMLLDLATTLLKPLGFDVRTFRDARKALAEYPTAKPVVVVTDYAMGDMNGMDLVRECKRLNPRQKTILMSGTVDEGVFADAQIKPDYFLAKPYQINDFVNVIQTLAKD